MTAWNIRPIASALWRNRTGALLVAFQIAIGLAVLVNAVYVVKQRVRGEQGAGPPGERAEHTEWSWRESDSLSIAQQKGIRLVQLECVESHTYWIQCSQVSALRVGDGVRRAELKDIRGIH